MKKALSFALAILLAFPLISCASSATTNDMILDNASAQMLNAEEAYDSGVSLIASEGAYIRSGSYASKTMAELPKNDFYYIKNDGSETTRHVVLKFDLSKFQIPEKSQSINVVVNFYSISPIHPEIGDGEVLLNAYKEVTTWNSQNVTFGSLPALSSSNFIGSSPLIKGDVFIDITDYVKQSIESGAKEIAIRLVPSVRTVAEMRICKIDNKLAPKLVAKEAESREFYQTKLLVDPVANQAIWDYAKKTYDEWKQRFDTIIAKGDYKTSQISSNKSDYTFTTSPSMADEPNKNYTFDTRLISTLSGFNANNEVKLDKFGGIISDTRYEATGYFYTKKMGDRWTVIDPLGYPCYITGINHTVYAYSNSDYQTKAMTRTFGTSEKWAISTTRWLIDDLGFNVALGTPHELLGVQNGIATTVYTHGLSEYASSVGLNASSGGTTQFLYNGTMPVFDPAFKTYLEEQIPKNIQIYADNPYVIGYISDNELPVADSMLTDYLTLDPSIPANHYSYACAWTWLIETTGKSGNEIDIYNIDKLNKESPIDLFTLFKGFVYDKYFSVVRPIIKETCPNQLYLGVRLLTGTDWGEWVGRVDGYWCDITCINYYHAWEVPTEQIENLQKWTGKPIMITEFYAKGADAKGADGLLFKNTDGAGWICKNQTERGYFYQNFTLRLLEAKNCVGWLYFQYIDNDPTDTTIEKGQSNSNKGIVNSDLDREVYKAYHSQISLINKNKYSLVEHFDGIDYFK